MPSPLFAIRNTLTGNLLVLLNCCESIGDPFTDFPSVKKEFHLRDSEHGSDVYVTSDRRTVEELLEMGSATVSMDGTLRIDNGQRCLDTGAGANQAIESRLRSTSDGRRGFQLKHLEIVTLEIA